MSTRIFPRRPAAVLVAGLAALLLAGLGLAWAFAARAEGPTRADVVARIESDPRMAGSPRDVVDCVADWYMTGATPEQRAAFVAGAVPVRDSAAEADPALVECLKRAA